MRTKLRALLQSELRGRTRWKTREPLDVVTSRSRSRRARQLQWLRGTMRSSMSRKRNRIRCDAARAIAPAGVSDRSDSFLAAVLERCDLVRDGHIDSNEIQRA